MNGMDIRLSYTNLRGILGTWTIRYESISDILILMFSDIIETFAGSYFFDILWMSGWTLDVQLCAMAMAFLHYWTTHTQFG